MNYFKHQLSQVDSESIGTNTKIWQYVVVLNGASIGNNCNICSHCFIEGKVKIGNNVTIKAGVYLWEGIEIEDNVFIGPNVVFTNDIYPRSKQFKEPIKTIIEQGVSLGANSTILAGLKIGAYAMTGIGSVVTKNLKSHGLYFGNPAKQHGWVDAQGEKLIFDTQKQLWIGRDSSSYQEYSDGLKKI
jgi:acetyltransferase-like isoleucine patch superfamily enzyme